MIDLQAARKLLKSKDVSLIRPILHREPHTRDQSRRAFNASGEVFRTLKATLDEIDQLRKDLIEERRMVLKLQHFPDVARKQLKAEGKI